jgi:hypothetical protein
MNQAASREIFLLPACVMLVSYSAYPSILKTGAIYSSETSADFHQNTLSCNTEERTLQKLMNWKESERKLPWPNLKYEYYPDICPE